MRITQIDEGTDERIAEYLGLSDADLMRRRGLFVAEGRLVVRRLLESGHIVRSVLVSPVALAGLRDTLARRRDDLPVFVAEPALLSGIVGYNVHRGCLALAERPAATTLDEWLPSAPASGIVVVLEQIGNADNVGAIFRNARAFGVSAVLLGPGCCDPLYRKAVRVSMAASLVVPAVHLRSWPDSLERLREAGFTVAVLTPAPSAEDVATVAARWNPGRLALLAGNEGDGVSAAAAAAASLRVRVPMAHGIDSLNVATALAVALHRFFERSREHPETPTSTALGPHRI